jgi:GNAT superfamily N-acetyltransferase
MQTSVGRTPHFEKPVALSDGRVVTLRHIRPVDAPLLLEFYAELSLEARRNRFFHTHRVTTEDCEHMAAVEGDGGVALVAVVEGAGIVADARCVRGRPDDTTTATEQAADFAIAIRDDYQQAGLGTLLLDQLLLAAASAGITTLVAEILGSNIGMRRLLSKREFAIADRDGSSMVQAIFRSDGRIPAWAAESQHPRVLIEGPGWWGSTQERHLRDAGYSVMVCPGPAHTGHCELVETGSCQLADGADAIICSLHDNAGREVLAAHHAGTEHLPLFVTMGPQEQPADGGHR